jgi:UDP-3-O-[3-hydroxymyristoyl] glucosamine N-acyltransferase
MEMTAHELAQLLSATLEGDPAFAVRGVAAPETAGAHDLIYADSPKHLQRAAASAAGCAILGPEAVLPGKVILRAAQPKLAFARAAAVLVAEQRIATGIHSTAVIAPSARLAPDVSVGPYAVIEEDVEISKGTQVGAFAFLGCRCRIGADCRIFPRVTLYPGARVGDRVTLHSGSVIGSDGFGYVFGEGRHWKFPQVGGVEIADDVEIGANTTIDRGALETTRIGRGVKLDNLVQVAHNVTIGEHSIVAAQTGISGSSRIGSRVMIGGQVGIADRCRVEDDAIVGAQAGVPSGKAVHARQVVWGTPARPLDRFKEQYAWLGRVSELAARLKKLESLVVKD